MGVSWGLLAGADVTDFVIILNTLDAVKAFSGVGNVQVSECIYIYVCVYVCICL